MSLSFRISIRKTTKKTAAPKGAAEFSISFFGNGSQENMSTVSIVSQIANTLFKGGPLDGLATVDFYNTAAAATPQNAVQQVEGQTAIAAANTAKTFMSTPGNPFVNALQQAAGGQKGTSPSVVSSLTNRIINAAGGNSSNIANDTTGLKSTILELMGSQPVDSQHAWIGSIRNFVQAAQSGRLMVNQITTSINNKSIDSATGIVSLLTSMTGNSDIAKILDMQSSFALGNAMLKTISELQIPALIDSVVNLYQTIEDQKYVLLGNLRNACLMSDMTAIQTTINKAGVSACVAQVPDIIKLILQYYRIPSTMLVPYTSWTLAPISAVAGTACALTISNYTASSPVTYSIGGGTQQSLGNTDAGGNFTGSIPIPNASGYPTSFGMTIYIGGSAIGSYVATALTAGSAPAGSAGSATVQSTTNASVGSSNYPALLTTLESILSQLNPTWYLGYRNQVQIPDLTVFSTMSADAMTLFQSSASLLPEDFFLMASFGHFFTPSDVLSVATRYYPKAAIVAPSPKNQPLAALGRSSTTTTSPAATIVNAA